jgi:hypothetical protein
MKPNIDLIKLGEQIHDAMRVFAKSSDKNWIWHNLEGGCAIGSWLLVKEAGKRNIQAKFIIGAGHCWVESNKYIYDITATQFKYKIYNNCLADIKGEMLPKVLVRKLSDLPKVYVRKLSDEDNTEYHYSFCRKNYYTDSKEGIIHINENWPVGQRIKDYRLTWKGDLAILNCKRKNKIVSKNTSSKKESI